MNVDSLSPPVWLSAYPEGVPATIDPDAYPSVHAMLLDSCARNAAAPAFDFFGAVMSYADWERASRAFAAYLINVLHRRPGDRIALMLPNVPAYPVGLLGVLRAGLVAVNVNPLYTPRELAQQLKDSGAVAIVVLENFAHNVAAICAETAITDVVVTRLGDFMPPLRRWAYNFVNAHVRRSVPAWQFAHVAMLHDICGRPADPDYADAQPSPSSPALLQYTGGTTGTPKGAILTHRNLVANTLQCCAWFRPVLSPGGERVLTPLPLYHIFSLTANLLAFAHLGGVNVLVPDPRNLRALTATMRRTKVTAMTGVNTLFNALAHMPQFRDLDFSALKITIGGGAAIQSAVAAQWQKVTGTTLIEGYGLTEASPVVCINPVDHRLKGGTVGLPVPSTEVSIRDDQGRPVAPGESGVLWVRGPQVMHGYWNRPEDTRKTLTQDGWLDTGDIAAVDEQGFVRILDRRKDVIIVSGFKVYPSEIEDTVIRCPGVVECAVVGVPDERTGEAVRLFVVRRDAGLTEEALREHCRANLAAYKCPRTIVFRDELPKSPIGKILRKELRGSAAAA